MVTKGNMKNINALTNATFSYFYSICNYTSHKGDVKYTNNFGNVNNKSQCTQKSEKIYEKLYIATTKTGKRLVFHAGKVHEKVFRYKEFLKSLTPLELRFLNHLISYTNLYNKAFPSQSLIAKCSGYDDFEGREAVNKLFQKAKQFGLISWYHQWNSSNVYRLTDILYIDEFRQMLGEWLPNLKQPPINKVTLSLIKVLLSKSSIDSIINMTVYEESKSINVDNSNGKIDSQSISRPPPIDSLPVTRKIELLRQHWEIFERCPEKKTGSAYFQFLTKCKEIRLAPGELPGWLAEIKEN